MKNLKVTFIDGSEYSRKYPNGLSCYVKNEEMYILFPKGKEKVSKFLATYFKNLSEINISDYFRAM